MNGAALNGLQVIVVQQRLQQFVIQGVILIQRAIQCTGIHILWVQWAQLMGTTAQRREGDMFLLHLQKYNVKQVALQICPLIVSSDSAAPH